MTVLNDWILEHRLVKYVTCSCHQLNFLSETGLCPKSNVKIKTHAVKLNSKQREGTYHCNICGKEFTEMKSAVNDKTKSNKKRIRHIRNKGDKSSNFSQEHDMHSVRKDEIINDILSSSVENADTKRKLSIRRKKKLANKESQECVSETHEHDSLEPLTPSETCVLCFVCGKTIISNSAFRKHLISHSDIKPHKCDQCGKGFREFAHLTSHIRIHTGEKPFECDVCGKKFTEKSTLKKHSRIHTNIKPFQCDVCGKDFSQSYHFKIHQRIHTGLKPHKCGACALEFVDRSNLNKHMMNKHSDGSNNGSHDATLNNGSHDATLNNGSHDATLNNGCHDETLRCDVCEKGFINSWKLKMHQRIHSNDRPHQCDECGKRFVDKSSMTRHVRTHTQVKPFSCDKCERCFNQSGSLRRHQQNRHEKAGCNSIKSSTKLQKQHQCNVCTKMFSLKHQLKRHLLTHSRNRMFTCDECGRAYKSQSSLRKHQIAHGQSGFKCEICHKQFYSIKGLKKHGKMHEAITLQPPPSEEFQSAAHLAQLMQFKCPICNIFFSTNTGLQEHYKSHENIDTIYVFNV